MIDNSHQQLTRLL